MKLCPKCGETKSLDNFTRNPRTKDGFRAWCKSCTKISNTAWRTKNPERWNSYAAKWKAADPEHALALERARYDADPEKSIAKTRQWQEDNPAEFSVLTIYRRTKRREVVPAWVDLEEIAKVYALARDIQELTGVRTHVDHVVPLRSPYVCGLHVHQNLQCLTQGENIAKGNKAWPDMWPITPELQQLVATGV